MKSNLAKWDRVLRFVVGALLIGLSLNNVIGVWGWVGIIFVVTAFINFCPLYRLIGFNTCPR